MTTPTSFTLVRLTGNRLSGCNAVTGNLTVNGFATDGVFLPAPAPAARRLEFVGDSISAGAVVGAGVA